MQLLLKRYINVIINSHKQKQSKSQMTFLLKTCNSNTIWYESRAILNWKNFH